MFKCEICGKSVKFKETLDMHMRALHGPKSKVKKERDWSQYPNSPGPSPPSSPKPKRVSMTIEDFKGDGKYTMKQLIDFEAYDYDKPFINIRTGKPYPKGSDFGINPRGDVIDSDFNYLGHWDKETKTIIPAKISKERGDGNEPLPILPADWLEIIRASQL
jgi:hypothetical protein